MTYREERKDTNAYKEAYLAGFERVIQQRQSECLARRKEYINEVFQAPEQYRTELRKLIGWPLTQPRDGIPNVKFVHLSQEETHTIFRVSFEILDGLWMTGLLSEPKVFIRWCWCSMAVRVLPN